MGSELVFQITVLFFSKKIKSKNAQPFRAAHSDFTNIIYRLNIKLFVLTNPIIRILSTKTKQITTYKKNIFI